MITTDLCRFYNKFPKKINAYAGVAHRWGYGDLPAAASKRVLSVRDEIMEMSWVRPSVWQSGALLPLVHFVAQLLILAEHINRLSGIVQAKRKYFLNSRSSWLKSEKSVELVHWSPRVIGCLQLVMQSLTSS